jgi:methionine-rich copper-binding protein CopC
MRALMVALALLLLPAAAGAMSMVESRPSGGAVVSGNGLAFLVRFDSPVDHRQSRFIVEQNGKVVETLQPRLDSAPDVLFARSPRLPPGEYSLHWSVRSMTDGGLTEGIIPFSVSPA